jgi:hypothetical protein
MTLKRIAEVMGKTEGYIKNLFVGVNEIKRNKELQTFISSHAGVTIQDVAETKSVKNQQERLDILGKRKEGKMSRAEMREKVKELATTSPEQKASVVLGSPTKQSKIHISIKAFPGLNKIIIYQIKGNRKEQLASIEKDVRGFFTANKEKYRVEKAISDKEDL